MSGSVYLDWLSGQLAVVVPPTSPSSGKADTVLGFAAGCGLDDVAPFIRSLRSVFSGRVIMVVDHNPTLQAYLGLRGVEFETISRPVLRWRPHPVVERFATFTKVLERNTDIGNVVIANVRDVVFQGDPFSGMPDELQFFHEADGHTLGEHASGLKHLRRLAGSSLARELSDRPGVCAGIVAGPADAMMRFCRSVLLLCAIPHPWIRGAFGADQAASNLIAHMDLVGGSICANYGRVATFALTSADQLCLVEGRILNPDGSASPIVHRYDHIEPLADHVAKRWGTSARAPRRHWSWLDGLAVVNHRPSHRLSMQRQDRPLSSCCPTDRKPLME